MTDDLFERAKDAADIEDVAGVKLYRAGRRRRGECPMCGKGAGKKSGGPFSIDPVAQICFCFICEEGGDAVWLEHKLRSVGGESMADAARRLVGDAVDTRSEAQREADRARRAQAREREQAEAVKSAKWKAALAARLWAEGVAAAGTLAQDYFEARGICGPVLARALGQLRFHPRAYHSGHPEFGLFLPAIIGLVMTEYGPTGGVHVTYLNPDGKAKTSRTPNKAMWGPQGHAAEGGVLRPGGVWLTPPTAAGPLVVAEGIENALSRAMIKAGDLSLPMRAVAARSLDSLQGHEAQDDDGARNVWEPTPDPQRPPFTWPEDPAHPWGEVDVATDGDMSPVRVDGRTGRGRMTKFIRDAAERARVCGRLAVIGWAARLAPDSETRVHASRPPIGRDFNDELRAAQAAGMSEAAA